MNLSRPSDPSPAAGDVETLYNQLRPATQLPFPPADDRGDREGDEMLAECIFYGNQRAGREGVEYTEEDFLFAIRLGRALTSPPTASAGEEARLTSGGESGAREAGWAYRTFVDTAVKLSGIPEDDALKNFPDDALTMVKECFAEIERLARPYAAPLRVALEPFARLAAQYDPPEGDDSLPLMQHDGDDLNIGHLRDARAALATPDAPAERDRVVEECARVAERFNGQQATMIYGSGEIADAIRALKGQG